MGVRCKSVTTGFSLPSFSPGHGRYNGEGWHLPLSTARRGTPANQRMLLARCTSLPCSAQIKTCSTNNQTCQGLINQGHDQSRPVEGKPMYRAYFPSSPPVQQADMGKFLRADLNDAYQLPSTPPKAQAQVDNALLRPRDSCNAHRRRRLRRCRGRATCPHRVRLAERPRSARSARRWRCPGHPAAHRGCGRR